jgi:hypothetical protein
MTSRQPPRLATSLLTRLASGPRLESLTGDLEEQFRKGRSVTWYWRQVAAAIVVDAVRGLRDHKLVAVWAAIVVWAVVITWVKSTWALYLWATKKWPILNQSTWWLWYGGGLQIAWCLGAALSGWITVRLMRNQRATMAIVTLISIMPLVFWWGQPWLMISFRTQAWYRIPQRVFALTVLVGMPIATLIGGLLVKPPPTIASGDLRAD